MSRFWEGMTGHTTVLRVRLVAEGVPPRQLGLDRGAYSPRCSPRPRLPVHPAYACYLAGVPLRVGQPGDLGGRLLTHSGPMHLACLDIPPEEVVETALGLLAEAPDRSGGLCVRSGS